MGPRFDFTSGKNEEHDSVYAGILGSVFGRQTARQDAEAAASAEESKKRALEDEEATKAETAQAPKTLAGEAKLKAEL